MRTDTAAKCTAAESIRGWGGMSQICVTTKTIFSVLMLSDFSGRLDVDPDIALTTSNFLAGSITDIRCG